MQLDIVLIVGLIRFGILSISSVSDATSHPNLTANARHMLLISTPIIHVHPAINQEYGIQIENNALFADQDSPLAKINGSAHVQKINLFLMPTTNVFLAINLEFGAHNIKNAISVH